MTRAANGQGADRVDEKPPPVAQTTSQGVEAGVVNRQKESPDLGHLAPAGEQKTRSLPIGTNRKKRRRAGCFLDLMAGP